MENYLEPVVVRAVMKSPSCGCNLMDGWHKVHHRTQKSERGCFFKSIVQVV